MFDNDIVHNPYLLASIVFCSALLLVSVYLPGLSDVLKTQPPGSAGWFLLLAMSLVPFVLGQGLRVLQARGQ